LERTKGKNISGLLLWAFIAAASAAFVAGIPVLAALLPFVPAYMAGRFGISGALIGVAAVAAGALIRPSIAPALILIAAPAALAAAWSVRKRKRFSSSVIFASVVALAGVALVFGLIWLKDGMTPVNYIVKNASDLFDQFTDKEVTLLYQSARVMDIQTGAITQEAVLATPRAQAISTMLSQLHEIVNELLVPIALIWSLLAGLLSYLVARAGAKKTGIPLQAIPAFSEWALPRRFWLAFIASYVAALIAENLNLIPSGLLSPTVAFVYGFLFSVQALSLADFLFKARDMRRGLRIGVHIVAVLLFGTLLMWVGIFENTVQFRRRIQEKGGEEV